MVERETWVVLLATASFALALFGYLGAIRRDLKAEFSGLRTELKGDIAELRTELKGDIADVKSDLSDVRADLRMLNQRTYDLSTRLPPAPASQR